MLAMVVPREPTVSELLLFHTGAPELVLHSGPLNELDGRCCAHHTKFRIKTTKTNALSTPSHQRHSTAQHVTL